MDYHSYRRSSFKPITCVYWKNGNCRHGDRCTYIHSYVCYNDGKCTDSRCNKAHVRQKDPSSYMRGRKSNRYESRSPKRRRSYSYSPKRRRSYSPTYSRSKSRSPYVSSRSRSPYERHSSRRSCSPYSRSRRSISSQRKASKSKKDHANEKSSARSNRSSSEEGKTGIPAKPPMYGDTNMEEEDDILNIKEDYSKDDMFKDLKNDSKSKEPHFKPISQVPESAVTEGKSSFPTKALEMLHKFPKGLFPEDDEDVKSISDEEAFHKAFLKALEQTESGKHGAAQGLPPVMKYPNDENISKSFQETHDTEAPLWTPALGRSKNENSKDYGSISNWEIETPYVSRREDTFLKPAPMGSSATKPGVQKKSSAESIKKKRKKRRRRHSSSSSLSTNSSSDNEHKKGKKTTSSKMTDKEGEEALVKKKNILSKVWSLMGQKKKLELQRDDIVVTHKGDDKSLTALLSENSNLSGEIDKQIFLMNQMVQLINDKLGISKLDAHQQEFYMSTKMMEDRGFPKLISLAVDKSSVEKSLSQFMMKSSEDSIDEHKTKDRKKSPLSLLDSRARKHQKKIRKSFTPPRPPMEVKKKSSKAFAVPTSGKRASFGIKQEELEEYAPSAAMKPHIKYIDQGMHWCKLCNNFFDSVTEFINHLESAKHLNRQKNDKKEWLPKPVKIEKDTVHHGTPVITIPLQGMEFMHSLTAFYCSLCDQFIKCREDALNHCETKIHVSKYKEFLSSNPMFETNQVKQKMAAFARYSVEKEKTRERGNSIEETEQEDFFSEIRRKSDDYIEENYDHELKVEKQFEEFTKNLKSDPLKESAEDMMSTVNAFFQEEEKHSENTESPLAKMSFDSHKEIYSPSYIMAPNLDSHYPTAPTSIRVSSRSADVPKHKESPEVEIPNVVEMTDEKETKMESLKKKLRSFSTESPIEEIFEAKPEEKIAPKKISSNFFIGKMPFLKKPKTPQTNNDKKAEIILPKFEEVIPLSTSEAEERIRKLVLQGLPNLNKKSDGPMNVRTTPKTGKKNQHKRKKKSISASADITKPPMPPTLAPIKPPLPMSSGAPTMNMSSPSQNFDAASMNLSVSQANTNIATPPMNMNEQMNYMTPTSGGPMNYNGPPGPMNYGGGMMPSGPSSDTGMPPGPPGGMMPQGPPGGMMPQGPPGGMMPQGPPGGMMPQGPPGGMMPTGPPGGMMPPGPPGGMMPPGTSPGGMMPPLGPPQFSDPSGGMGPPPFNGPPGMSSPGGMGPPPFNGPPGMGPPQFNGPPMNFMGPSGPMHPQMNFGGPPSGMCPPGEFNNSSNNNNMMSQRGGGGDSHSFNPPPKFHSKGARSSSSSCNANHEPLGMRRPMHTGNPPLLPPGITASPAAKQPPKEPKDVVSFNIVATDMSAVATDMTAVAAAATVVSEVKPDSTGVQSESYDQPDLIQEGLDLLLEFDDEDDTNPPGTSP